MRLTMLLRLVEGKLTDDQKAELHASEVAELDEDEARTERLRGLDAKTRASWTPVSERWIAEKRVSAERTSQTRAPARRAFFLRLAELAEERRELVIDAQKPMIKAGYGRNKYQGKCSDCSKAVAAEKGWFTKAQGRTIVLCHDCTWKRVH